MTTWTPHPAVWSRAASQPISKADVVDLLTRTSTNNATGLIGSAYSVTGYTLSGALAIVERCEHFERGSYNRHDSIAGLLPGHGVHLWYLNLQVRKEDPWT